MTTVQFSAIGTEWCVLIDQALPQESIEALSQKLEEETTRFDERYSRFLPMSWLSQVNAASQRSQDKPVRHELDQEAEELFSLGKELETLSNGAFTLNIGSELEALGYDASYSLTAHPLDADSTPKGTFQIAANTLITQGRVSLDLGSFGKGFLIDRVAQILERQKISHYLIDGSGDFYGTSKANEAPWSIALEHPSDPEAAIGKAEVHFQGLASSSPLRRRWKDAHHILNGHTGKPIDSPVAVFTTASTATLADALSTAYFVASPQDWPKLRERWEHAWCLIDGSADSLVASRSPKFPGELFTLE